jgi:hypothetical protein
VRLRLRAPRKAARAPLRLVAPLGGGGALLLRGRARGERADAVLVRRLQVAALLRARRLRRRARARGRRALGVPAGLVRDRGEDLAQEGLLGGEGGPLREGGQRVERLRVRPARLARLALLELLLGGGQEHFERVRI